MARGDQFTRQWRLLHLLAARGGHTVEELQRETGCSRRTVWRDLRVLQAAGFPLTCERDGRASRYGLIEGARSLPPIPFTLPELMALHLGRDLLAPLLGTPADEAIRSVLDKIAATLNPAAKAFLDRLSQMLSARTVHAKRHHGSLTTFQTLQEGIRARRTIEGEYHSLGRDALTRRRLDPLHLWLQQGGIYLAAYCHLRKDVRTFALERFRQARPTADTFEPPPGFHLEAYLRGSFGLFRGRPVRVVLRFSRAVARFVAEREWHPSQVLAPLLTGELELTLTAPICPELRRWVLGYGKEVEVVEPKALHDSIRREWLAALRGPGGRAEPAATGRGAVGRTYRPVKPRPALLAAEAASPAARRAARTASRR
jgi:predicted DNA-binding transcriptional regulator YafY